MPPWRLDFPRVLKPGGVGALGAVFPIPVATDLRNGHLGVLAGAIFSSFSRFGGRHLFWRRGRKRSKATRNRRPSRQSGTPSGKPDGVASSKPDGAPHGAHRLPVGRADLEAAYPLEGGWHWLRAGLMGFEVNTTLSRRRSLNRRLRRLLLVCVIVRRLILCRQLVTAVP